MITTKTLRVAMQETGNEWTPLLGALYESMSMAERCLEDLRGSLQRDRRTIEELLQDPTTNPLGLQSATDRLMAQYVTAKYAIRALLTVCEADPEAAAVIAASS